MDLKKDLDDDSTSDPEVHRIGDRYVAISEHHVVGISRDGERTWKREFDEDELGIETEIVAGMVVVKYERPGGDDAWPPPHMYVGIDAKTGKTKWETTGAPYGSAAGDFVLTPTCRSEQTNAMDDCQVSARDARTGAVRWTIPTEHVPEIESYDDGVLTLTTRPLGYDGKHWLTSYDADTGARLGLRAELETFGGELLYPKGSKRTSGPTFMTGARVVLTSEEDTKYPEKCELRMVALNARTGAQDWKRNLPTGDPMDDHCTDVWADDSRESNRVVTGSTPKEEPVVFDLAKNKRPWTGAPGASVLATDEKVTLVEDQAGLSLLELDSGKKRWSDTPAPSWSNETGVRMHGKRLLVYPENCHFGCQVRLYDLEKGLLDVTVRGTYAGSDEGWVATREGMTISVTTIP